MDLELEVIQRRNNLNFIQTAFFWNFHHVHVHVSCAESAVKLSSDSDSHAEFRSSPTTKSCSLTHSVSAARMTSKALNTERLVDWIRTCGLAYEEGSEKAPCCNRASFRIHLSYSGNTLKDGIARHPFTSEEFTPWDTVRRHLESLTSAGLSL